MQLASTGTESNGVARRLAPGCEIGPAWSAQGSSDALAIGAHHGDVGLSP